MYVVLVEFTTHAEHSAAFLQRVRQQAEDSLRDESDCHVFDVCVDPERDNFVLLYELYSDRAAFEAHLGSPHFHAFDAAVQDWVSDKKVSLLQEVTRVGPS